MTVIHTKASVVAAVQKLQAIRGLKVNAESTLLRTPLESLLETAELLCEKDYFLNKNEADVSVAPAVVADIMKTVTKNKQAKVVKALPTEGDESNGRRGRTPLASDDAVITVCFDKVPGREGTDSWKRRDILRSGMTVGEFVAAAGEKGRSSLRRSIRRGWVKVSEPEVMVEVSFPRI